jgi:hypothetical protein
MSLIFNNLDLQHKTIVIVEDDLPSVKYYKTTGKAARSRVFGMEKSLLLYQ